jgi:hypothetical protein
LCIIKLENTISIGDKTINDKQCLKCLIKFIKKYEGEKNGRDKKNRN